MNYKTVLKVGLPILIVAGALYLVRSKRVSGEIPGLNKIETEVAKTATPSIESIEKTVLEDKLVSEKGKSDLAFEYYVNSTPITAHFRELGIKVFGTSPSGVAAANWIALTLHPENSAAYGKRFKGFLEVINREPASILSQMEKERKTIVENNFMHTMSINLIHQLNVPPIVKAHYLAKELSLPFELNEEGSPTPRTANQIIALSYLRDYNVKSEDIHREIQNAVRSKEPGSADYIVFQNYLSIYVPGTEKYFN